MYLRKIRKAGHSGRFDDVAKKSGIVALVSSIVLLFGGLGLLSLKMLGLGSFLIEIATIFVLMYLVEYLVFGIKKIYWVVDIITAVIASLLLSLIPSILGISVINGLESFVVGAIVLTGVFISSIYISNILADELNKVF
jgi:hypothetical protein